jgi:hypothetical protein
VGEQRKNRRLEIQIKPGNWLLGFPKPLQKGSPKRSWHKASLHLGKNPRKFSFLPS